MIRRNIVSSVESVEILNINTNSTVSSLILDMTDEPYNFELYLDLITCFILVGKSLN